MYKKAETFPIFLTFFQALSTLGHLFLPRQRIERIWGVKAEKRQRQKELRSQKEFLTSLRLRSSRIFTHTHCSTDSSVTYWEPAPGNKAPDCQCLKRQSHLWWEHRTRTGCHYRCAQRAGTTWLLAVRKSRAAYCEAGGQPNDEQMFSTGNSRYLPHAHPYSDSPRVTSASRQGAHGKAGMQFKLVNQAPFLGTDGGQAPP